MFCESKFKRTISHFYVVTICADWGNHAGHRCDSDGARGSWLIPDDDEDEDEDEEEEEEDEEDEEYTLRRTRT